MNVTTATVNSGDRSISFPITPPLWTSVASVASRSRGRLVSLSFTTPAEQTPVPYQLHCWTQVDYPTYPFTVQTGVAKNNLVAKLDVKLHDHLVKMGDFWPLHSLLPRLYYVGPEVRWQTSFNSL